VTSSQAANLGLPDLISIIKQQIGLDSALRLSDDLLALKS